MTELAPLAPAGATDVIETPAVVATTPETTETAQNTEAAPETPEQPRGPDGKFIASHPRTEKLQTQINALTAEKRQTEREVARLKSEAAELAKQLQQPADIDPADFDAQTAHRVRHEIKSDRLEQTVTQIKNAEAVAYEKTAQIIRAQVDDLRTHIPDIDTIYNEPKDGGPIMSKAMTEAVLRSENGALVAYHLKNNPREAARIHDLDPISAFVAIGQISAQVSNPKNQMKRISQAPAPVQTVSGGAGSPSLDLNTASFKDYEQARLKQMAAQP